MITIDLTEPSAALTTLVRDFAVLSERLDQPGVSTDEDFDRGWAEHARAVVTLDRHGIAETMITDALASGTLDTRDGEAEFSDDAAVLLDGASADTSASARAYGGTDAGAEADDGAASLGFTEADIARVREAVEIAATAPDVAVAAVLAPHRIYLPAVSASFARARISDMHADDAAFAGLLAGLRIAALPAADRGGS